VAVLAVLAAAAGVVLATQSSSSSPSTSAAAAQPTRRQLDRAFHLVATTPATGTTGVDAAGPFTVTFSKPLAKNSPLPSFSPKIFGTWTRVTPTTMSFTPAADLPVGASVTMTIPGGRSGIRAATKKHLPDTQTVSFTIDPGTTMRMQQLLAQLNYLPVSFVSTAVPAPTPTTTTPTHGSGSHGGRAAPIPTTTPTTTPAPPPPPPVSSLQQPGQFAWRWPDVPAQLQAQWQPGVNNVISTGALMQFESAHGFATSNDPTPTPQVWWALLQAASANQVASTPYTWVMVSRAQPETLTVWQNGASVFSSPANTGISASPTVAGTFPVYERFTVTTMSGHNPDGSVYHDPGVPDVSYFNGGDAIHGFARPGYGYPQSLGCVELPFSAAAAVYPLTPIGTLVTVL